MKVASLKNLQGYLWETGYRTGAYSTPLFPDVAPVLKRWSGKEGVRVAIYSSGSVFAQKLLFGHVAVLEGGEGGADADADAETLSNGQPSDQSSSTVTSSNGDAERKTSNGGSRTEDLTGLMSGWFDTTNAGLKMEASSYRKIVESLAVSARLPSHVYCEEKNLWLTRSQWQPAETLFLSDNIKEVDAAIEAGLKSILVDRPGNAAVSESDRARVDVVQSLEELKLEAADSQSKASGAE